MIGEVDKLGRDNQQPKSFLIPMWERIFIFLEKLSIFYFIRLKVPKVREKYWFVDAWVLGNLIFAIVSVYIVSYVNTPRVLAYIIVAYGLLRVFEIFIYQMNVLLVHPFKNAGTGRAPYTLFSYRRMTVALIHNFFEIIFWFATTYVAFQFTFENTVGTLNPIIIVYYSFITMVSYTSNLDKESWTLLAATILHMQAIMGLFMTVLSFARFVSLFPKPATMDDLEKEFTIDDDIKRIEKQLEELHTKLDRAQVNKSEEDSSLVSDSYNSEPGR